MRVTGFKAPEGDLLVRAMGRWTLTALVLNSILGSSIFRLPSEITRLLGPYSGWAYVLAALGNIVIVACFAEVASRFTRAGGAYLYARESLGRFAGIQIGWMTFLVRITAVAAGVNVFASYLGGFWAPASQGAARVAVITLLLLVIGGINFVGVRGGAQMSNVFTAAKLVPLGIFIAAGIWYVLAGNPSQYATNIHVEPTAANWAEALFLLAFAYGGFDAALIPMAEARSPRKDAPFALFSALLLLAGIYISIQLLVMAILPAAAQSSLPLAAAAQISIGPAGAALISLGALISIYGYLSANALTGPRLPFALAQEGDFPALFGRVHPRFRTPHVAIVAFFFLIWALAVYGNFAWNAMLSGVARLFTYAAVCCALLVFRRRDPDGATLRLPAGEYIALLGLLLSLALVSRMGARELYVVLATVAIAGVNWAVVRRS